MNRREFFAAAAAIAIAPRSLAAAATPAAVALVTADLESHVVVVDLRSGATLGDIRTPASPRSIEQIGSAGAVVCHSELGIVSVLDARSREVVHTLTGFGEPRYVAAHPDGRHAYVTDAKRGEIVLIDARAGRVLARERVGWHARHVTIDPAARRLWVALGSTAREIAVVDVTTLRPRLIARFASLFLAHDVAFAPDGRHAWISAGEGRELAVYDRRSDRVIASPSAGWPPQHVAFSGGAAYVTSGWTGSLQVHALDGRLRRSAPVPVGSYNVEQAEGLVVTPALGRGFLTTIDLDGRPFRRQKVARSCHDACIVLA